MRKSLRFTLVGLTFSLGLVFLPRFASAQCGSIVRFRNIECGCDTGTWTETYTVGDAPSGYQDGQIECGFSDDFPCMGGYVQSCPSGRLSPMRKPSVTNARNRPKRILVITGISNSQLSALVPMCGKSTPKSATASLLLHDPLSVQ
jgi:hypothetical protein